ncbi:MFS transporter [Streptosporangium sandarakinum]|uniref:MFS family permease n=1 Tax=Streptosporangium sandarakinum TaxID=1260955 RepID=A0A852VBI4_9ACTN|nr:MFS transporter [Streptosporangium sandarakinum]NYF44414.1 MFS family permease [Streptosporangium sandarakinum]
MAVVAHRFLLPGPEDAERSAEARDPAAADDHAAAPPTLPAQRAGRRSFTGPAVRMLAALGVLAACGALVEDAGASWGALFLTGLHADAATAGLAVVVFQTAMTIGRLSGDRVVDRFGQRAVARAGGVLAAAGMGAALAVPSIPAALAGFTLAGLGFATLVPAAMHTADELPGLPPGTGLTIVSWLLRGGFLLSPLLVGAVADLLSLRAGLLSVVLAGLVTIVLARVLTDRTHASA